MTFWHRAMTGGPGAVPPGYPPGFFPHPYVPPGPMPPSGVAPAPIPGPAFPPPVVPGGPGVPPAAVPGVPGMPHMPPSGAIIPGTPVVPAPGSYVPGQLPIEESYIENILRLNLGKMATIYMTFENNAQWNARVFRGRLEAAGRDHIIISDPQTGTRYLLLMVNLDYITFDEPLNYVYPFATPQPPIAAPRDDKNRPDGAERPGAVQT